MAVDEDSDRRSIAGCGWGAGETREALAIVGDTPNLAARLEGLAEPGTILISESTRWDQAKGGEGQVTLLSGEAGIGKSRITKVIHEHAEQSGHVRIRYQCSPPQPPADADDYKDVLANSKITLARNQGARAKG